MNPYDEVKHDIANNLEELLDLPPEEIWDLAQKIFDRVLVVPEPEAKKNNRFNRLFNEDLFTQIPEENKLMAYILLTEVEQEFGITGGSYLGGSDKELEVRWVNHKDGDSTGEYRVVSLTFEERHPLLSNETIHVSAWDSETSNMLSTWEHPESFFGKPTISYLRDILFNFIRSHALYPVTEEVDNG